MNEPKRLLVFYSWQSDLPDSSNRAFIRRALKKAASSIETSHGGVIVDVDEATRNVSGSPNIPATILSKISLADVFIGDVTTINATAPGRRFPNPNVVFELGYAVAHVGWERSILLFNQEHGAFPDDLPFDFDRHRVSAFTASITPSDKQQRHLAELLSTALDSVIRSNPSKPNSNESPEKRTRNRDIENIKWILSTIHLPTLDQHARDCPYKVSDKALFFWEGFNDVMNNSLFHLYNQKLLELFRRYHKAFYETVQHGELYHSTADSSAHIFTNPGDLPLSPPEEAAWKTIQKGAQSMSELMRDILEEVRGAYQEVDVDNASGTAWRDYITHRKNLSQPL
jgi:hypothetical protein